MSNSDIPNPMHRDSNPEPAQQHQEVFQNERMAMRPTDNAAAAGNEPGSRAYDIVTCKQLLGVNQDGNNDVNPGKFNLIKGFVDLVAQSSFNRDDMQQVANRLGALAKVQKNPHAQDGLQNLAGLVKHKYAS